MHVQLVLRLALVYNTHGCYRRFAGLATVKQCITF